MCAENVARNSVDLYIDMLAYTHTPELCFFKVSQDPNVLFDHCHQRLPRLNARAGLNRFLGNHAIARRDDIRVRELKFSGGEGRFGCGQISDRGGEGAIRGFQRGGGIIDVLF